MNDEDPSSVIEDVFIKSRGDCKSQSYKTETGANEVHEKCVAREFDGRRRDHGFAWVVAFAAFVTNVIAMFIYICKYIVPLLLVTSI